MIMTKQIIEIKRQKIIGLLFRTSSGIKWLKRAFVMYTIAVLAAPWLLFTTPVEAIGIRGTPTTATVALATSLVIDKPTGTVSGDVMIAIFAIDGQDNTGSGPAGWTRFQRSNNTSALTVDGYVKVAGASEPANYTFTTSGLATRLAGGITTYTGVDNSNAVNVSGGNTQADNSTTCGVGAITTTVNNTRVGVALAMDHADTRTWTPPTSYTEQYDIAIDGILTNAISLEYSDITQATAGTTGSPSADASGSGDYAGFIFALQPAVPILEQVSYRFSVNADNTDPAHITSNPSANDDTVEAIANDTVNSVFFTVGYSTTNLLIEKRRIADGSLCTSTNCGTTFGTGGQIIEDVASSADEGAYAMAIDNGGGHIYIAGYDKVGTDKEWRIEKRDMLSGNLVSGFGTSGVVQSDPTAGDDEPISIVIDTVGDFIYVGGYDSGGGSEWRIEKRRMSDGALCDATNCGTAFDTDGILINNLSGGDDKIGSMDIDPTSSNIFISGFDTSNGNTSWRIEKRLASTGALCTGGACGTDFSGDGVYTSNPTSGGDQATTMKVDDAADAIYIGGYESTGGKQWRVEKITASSGTAISAFGGSGSITSNPSAGDDQVTDLELDGSGGFLYVMGTDANGSNQRWRIEKRQRSDGSLVTSWATSGVATIDPSSNNDPAKRLIIDTERGLLWAVGGDRTLGASNMRWYYTEIQLDTGTMWLAAADTIGGISSNVTFRLRLLLHNTNGWLTTDDANLKLQFASKEGTCDTAFTGESYADVATSGTGEILYHDNPSVSDATAIVTKSGEDPTHSGHTVIGETIEESNNFTIASNITSGQDGLWDFALKDNSAFGAYCFRAVYSDGTPLSSYSQIPEITFCKDDPKTTALLRHGTYFCEGSKRSFFWAL